ncbi:unnamed protein product [Oikopleura dioica]|uniref:Uncharacterized protein n=1 Tax=Oikopleura dioica TaxID=34765 RepID=E4X8E4_OIKDI|nr:unnamed protein product [Oikopleura dioica]
MNIENNIIFGSFLSIDHMNMLPSSKKMSIRRLLPIKRIKKIFAKKSGPPRIGTKRFRRHSSVISIEIWEESQIEILNLGLEMTKTFIILNEDINLSRRPHEQEQDTVLLIPTDLPEEKKSGTLKKAAGPSFAVLVLILVIKIIKYYKMYEIYEEEKAQTATPNWNPMPIERTTAVYYLSSSDFEDLMTDDIFKKELPSSNI